MSEWSDMIHAIVARALDEPPIWPDLDRVRFTEDNDPAQAAPHPDQEGGTPNDPGQA